MNPLTKKDIEEMMLPLKEFGINGKSHTKVIRSYKVLSALALARKKLRDKLCHGLEEKGCKEDFECFDCEHINKILDECFQIGQDAKGMAEIKALGLNPEELGKRSGKSIGDNGGNSGEQVETLSSSQDPARYNNKCELCGHIRFQHSEEGECHIIDCDCRNFQGQEKGSEVADSCQESVSNDLATLRQPASSPDALKKEVKK